MEFCTSIVQKDLSLYDPSGIFYYSLSGRMHIQLNGIPGREGIDR